MDWWVYGKIDACKNPSKVVACRDMKIVLTKCGHVLVMKQSEWLDFWICRSSTLKFGAKSPT